MKTLIEHFNILYPAYSAQAIVGATVTVEECEAEDKQHYVRRLHITDFNGWQIPHEISKTNTQLYQLCQQSKPVPKEACHELVRKDCDGLLPYPTDNAHVLLAVEIKTSFDADDILLATRQIIGSIVKLDNMMSLTRRYDRKKIKYKGVIVSRGATASKITGWKDIRDAKTRYLARLAQGKPCVMRKSDLEAVYHPLTLRDIEILHLDVAPGVKETSVTHAELRSRYNI